MIGISGSTYDTNCLRALWYSMLSVRTSNGYTQQRLYWLFVLVATTCLWVRTDSDGDLLSWLWKLIILLLDLRLCSHTRWRCRLPFSQRRDNAQSLTIDIHSLRSCWTLLGHGDYPNWPMLSAGTYRLHRLLPICCVGPTIWHLKRVESHVFSGISRSGFSLKVYCCLCISLSKLNSKSQSCTTLFTINSCEMISIVTQILQNWRPYQMLEEAYCFVQNVSIFFYSLFRG